MNIAIVGATGNVGRKIIEILEKKKLLTMEKSIQLKTLKNLIFLK